MFIECIRHGALFSYLTGLHVYKYGLLMANQQCTPPRLARREFLLAVGAAVPFVAQGCGTQFEVDEFGDDFRGLPNGNLGFAQSPPGPVVTNAEVNVIAPLQNHSFKNDDQACSVSKSLAGVMIGDQVRVVRGDNDYALYTVLARQIGDEPDVVRMGTSARQRVGTSNPFAGTLVKPVVASGLTDAEAEAADEFVERLVDDGDNVGLVVIAPHGGIIEVNTDRQAEAVTAALGCSSWICKGWKAGGGGYDRWHITSTRISPRSFPGLKVIANRGFAYSVAFHGMSSAGVLIGGAAPHELKQMLKAAILDELPGNIEVEIAEPGDANSGHSEKSVHNWLTADGFGGIQIEQSPNVRNGHWEEVANAVINLYSQLI
jgi:phage replication-related protein YjqB (UPF0714/DUF867 family)